MHTTRLSALALLVVCLLVPIAALGQDEDVGGPDESVEVLDFDPTYFLYVISGESAEIDGDVLTLVDAPSVLYFSDRPKRVTGHMDPAAWVETWDQGPGSFADVPPNAVLVVGAPEVHELVVELLDTAVEGDDLRFHFEVLAGEVPSEALEPASLFIDSGAGPFETLQGAAMSDPELSGQWANFIISWMANLGTDHDALLSMTSDDYPCTVWGPKGATVAAADPILWILAGLVQAGEIPFFDRVAERCGAPAWE